MPCHHIYTTSQPCHLSSPTVLALLCLLGNKRVPRQLTYVLWLVNCHCVFLTLTYCCHHGNIMPGVGGFCTTLCSHCAIGYQNNSAGWCRREKLFYLLKWQRLYFYNQAFMLCVHFIHDQNLRLNIRYRNISLNKNCEQLHCVLTSRTKIRLDIYM